MGGSCEQNPNQPDYSNPCTDDDYIGQTWTIGGLCTDPETGPTECGRVGPEYGLLIQQLIVHVLGAKYFVNELNLQVIKEPVVTRIMPVVNIYLIVIRIHLGRIHAHLNIEDKHELDVETYL